MLEKFLSGPSKIGDFWLYAQREDLRTLGHPAVYAVGKVARVHQSYFILIVFFLWEPRPLRSVGWEGSHTLLKFLRPCSVWRQMF